MKVLSFNIREIYRDLGKTETNWKSRMCAMKKMIKDINPDIICFQEMTFPANLYIPVGYKRVGFSINHHIYIWKSFTYKEHKFKIHEESAKITTDKNQTFYIINVHSHWDPKILKKTVEYINTFKQPYIACGDFNNFIYDISAAGLSETLNLRFEAGLPAEDTFINFDRPEESHGEIDHFYSNFVSEFKYSIIKDLYGSPCRISDHYPILLEF